MTDKARCSVCGLLVISPDEHVVSQDGQRTHVACVPKPETPTSSVVGRIRDMERSIAESQAARAATLTSSGIPLAPCVVCKRPIGGGWTFHEWQGRSGVAHPECYRSTTQFEA